MAQTVKCLPAMVGDLGSTPGLGRSLGEGNGNPLQYPCLENPMDGGACMLQSMGSQRVRLDWATSLHFKGTTCGSIQAISITIIDKPISKQSYINKLLACNFSEPQTDRKINEEKWNEYTRSMR